MTGRMGILFLCVLSNECYFNVSFFFLRLPSQPGANTGLGTSSCLGLHEGFFVMLKEHVVCCGSHKVCVGHAVSFASMCFQGCCGRFVGRSHNLFPFLCWGTGRNLHHCTSKESLFSYATVWFSLRVFKKELAVPGCSYLRDDRTCHLFTEYPKGGE